MLNLFHVMTNNQHVIDIEQENNKFLTREFLHKHTMIRRSFCIPMIHHEGIKFLIPLPWSLFKTIQALLQSADKLLFTFDCKTIRLLHVNFFLQITMEKGGLHIKLLDL